MLTGDNGILKQATNTKERTENAQVLEERLSEYEDFIDKATGVIIGGNWDNEKGVNTPIL